MNQRRSGILLHITSLPSAYGIGDLGQGAYRFVDLLHQAKQRYWQILPINPTDAVNFHSPYSCYSAFAGNELLINPELLVNEGYLKPTDVKEIPHFPEHGVDYASVLKYKNRLLDLAFENFQKHKSKKFTREKFTRFCESEQGWLEDFSKFIVLKENFGGKVWSDWPQELRDRRESALKDVGKEFSVKIERVKFRQFLFFTQWMSLREYCQRKNVAIIGDIPIYVNYDSAEVWTHPSLFQLDKDMKLKFVAGVPPDYFSKTGQRWGNPVYDWDKSAETNYAWWIERLQHNLRLFDIIRIDHFRGFVAYWRIPVKERTAIRGEWVPGPGQDFFNALLKHCKELPLIAEDLGIITPDVTTLIHQLGFPGMKVLLFAFGGDKMNPYLPHHHVRNCVIYTGTHDNNTVRGWFEKDATPQEKENFKNYVRCEIQAEEIHWVFIEMAMKSVADTVIIPLQDVLGLGAEARMNTPSTLKGNWGWRFDPRQLDGFTIERLAKITEDVKRA